MIYKETLPFIDIFKFTSLDRTELAGKLIPFFTCSLSSLKLQAEFTYKFNLFQGITDARPSVYKAAAIPTLPATNTLQE